jgi:hypothetical protein
MTYPTIFPEPPLIGRSALLPKFSHAIEKAILHRLGFRLAWLNTLGFSHLWFSRKDQPGYDWHHQRQAGGRI